VAPLFFAKVEKNARVQSPHAYFTLSSATRACGTEGRLGALPSAIIVNYFDAFVGCREIRAGWLTELDFHDSSGGMAVTLMYYRTLGRTPKPFPLRVSGGDQTALPAECPWNLFTPFRLEIFARPQRRSGGSLRLSRRGKIWERVESRRAA
jgi:hypothetical protein